jgi:Arc/MetJ-type ribon-helix-helix transcriptional regulator
MVRLTIELPDEVRKQLQSRATAGGFGSVEHYARAVLEATAEDGLDQGAVEQLLVERSREGGPGIEFTADWAQQFRQQVRERREHANQQPESGEGRP